MRHRSQGGGGLNTCTGVKLSPKSSWFLQELFCESINCLAQMEDSLIMQCIITAIRSDLMVKLEMFQCYIDARPRAIVGEKKSP